jgi:SAM-dependent methyltransferase
MHNDRVRAESFGAVAELYDRARPSYPEALIDALLAGGAARVLDVGCGTGIAGALLAARGCAVLGVEVDGRMAAVARAKGLEVEVAPFERWDPAGRTFDLVTAAQAWHWIEPRRGSPKAAAVLRGGGSVALFWNTGDPEPTLRERLDPVYASLEPGLRERAGVLERRARRGRAALDSLARSGEFGPVAVRRIPWSRRYGTEAWLEYLASHSDHQTLPADRRTRLLAALGEAIERFGGSFEVAFETILLSATRR